jgi:hypothetical protein
MYPRRGAAMLSFPIELARELTEDDVLRVDPVREYDRRLVWREWANRLFAQVGDGVDEVLERGRPTGP